MRHHKKKRRTSNGPAMRCVPHQKEAFWTRQAAVRALARYALRSTSEDYPRRVYRDSCGFFHLTKNL